MQKALSYSVHLDGLPGLATCDHLKRYLEGGPQEKGRACLHDGLDPPGGAPGLGHR